MKKLFERKSQKQPIQPQIGMSWDIVSYRPSAIMSEHKNVREQLSHIQIVAVNDDTIETMQDGHLSECSTNEWAQRFGKKLSHTATQQTALGIEIHRLKYLGIHPVAEDIVENARSREEFCPLI